MIQTQAKESLTDQVYRVLKKDITVCEIAPGTRLVEGELAARFEMSKTPVREALAQLEQEHLVQVMPRIGYVVTPISLADMHEVFSLRSLLEAEAVSLATLRMGDLELEALLAEATRGAPMSAGPFEATESLLLALGVNRTFHSAIARASGNQRLADMVCRLIDETSRLIFIDRSLHPEEYLHFPDHIRLVHAMQMRDVGTARKAMSDHIEYARKRIFELVVSSQTGIPLRMNDVESRLTL
jgi:DNA-binding GntR family transcriptional regulator